MQVKVCFVIARTFECVHTANLVYPFTIGHQERLECKAAKRRIGLRVNLLPLDNHIHFFNHFFPSLDYFPLLIFLSIPILYLKVSQHWFCYL
jgi:hypothetical protein